MFKVATTEYDLDEARAVIAGYCWHAIPAQWKTVSPSFGELPSLVERPRWAYFTYDCLRRSEGDRLLVEDLLAPVGLNVSEGYGVELLANLLTMAPHIAECVSTIPKDFRFWQLDPDDLNDETLRDNRDSPAYRINRAWFLTMSVRGVGPAIAHKLLHHKWPEYFPILDNLTLELLGPTPWIRILSDTKQNAFDVLETWFRASAADHGTVPVNRLRLHDILLWCEASRERDRAAAAGAKLLTG